MNNQLADQIIDILTTRPDLHSQRSWYGATTAWAAINNLSEDKVIFRTKDDFVTQLDREPDLCDTTACVAGWAVALTTPGYAVICSETNIKADGRAALDLTNDQAETLFLDVGSTEAVVSVLKYLKDHPEASGQEIIQSAVPLPLADHLLRSSIWLSRVAG